VVEHDGQFAGHSLDLLVGQREAREARDVEDLVTVDHVGRF
jgi:hypothetical protein